jgi:hypothetical protein
MRTFLTVVVILAVLIGGVALYLYFTTPHETAAVSFPLSGTAHAMVASVPASAEAFAYVPRAAALESKLRANPVTRDIIESWSTTRSMPRPWMIGGADLLAWQSGKQTRYLLRLDPVRAALVRVYMNLTGNAGGTVLINAPTENPITADEVAAIEALAAKLPQGDALVVQRSNSRGAYPPIGRPAVSSVEVTPTDINITSRANGGGQPPPAVPLQAHYADGALLSASFASMPALFKDLDRMFGKKVSDLVANGGSLTLYDVRTGTLLPSPKAVIGLPTDADAEQLTKLGARTARKDGELIVSFDDSIDTYQKDTVRTTAVPGGRWAARIDAARMAPILEKIQDNVGLRIASPRLFRSARDLGRWIGNLREAKMIDATATSDGSVDELKVRVSAK